MTELFHLPRQGATILLAGLRDILHNTPNAQSQPALLPKDPRTVYSRLHLDPQTEAYICCPACWALTPYSPTALSTQAFSEDNGLELPVCQDKLTSQSDICGAELWAKKVIGKKVQLAPQRIYLHQLLKHWLGRLLSRPGMEDIIDNYPREASQRGDGESMSDIWSSPAIQSLLGPDGEVF
ncbi:hypothetical protein C8J57DRAFT_1088459, partial [Mycena rebaudengoi]